MSRESLQASLAVTTVLLLAIGGPWLLEQARRPAPRGSGVGTAVVPSGQRRVTLELAGMTCASCASRVTDQLRTTAGVRACDVDARTGRATVLCDNGVADSSLFRAVTRASRAFTATIAAP